MRRQKAYQLFSLKSKFTKWKQKKKIRRRWDLQELQLMTYSERKKSENKKKKRKRKMFVDERGWLSSSEAWVSEWQMQAETQADGGAGRQRRSLLYRLSSWLSSRAKAEHRGGSLQAKAEQDIVAGPGSISKYNTTNQNKTNTMLVQGGLAANFW
jgi:hypothetical protein